MMRLRRLDLTRYGKFTDHSIDFGARAEGRPDLHIVYGLNEAGKSTTLSAYLDLLFGIEERTRYAFLHPYGAMEIGAALEFGGTIHELSRVKQRSNALKDGRGQAVNEALLGAPLAGLTRESYRTMFSLDDQTLEDGGNAILESKSDLGELLFSASAGLSDLSHTLDAIGAEADEIFRKRASSTRIAVLKRELHEMKARREAIDVQASQHAALSESLRQAEQSYEAASRGRAEARARHEERGRILRAAPLALEYARLARELDGLGDLPRPPASWAGELPQFMSDNTRLQTTLANLDTRIDALKDEIAGIVIAEPLLALEDRLERLTEAAARYRGAEDDLPKRRASLIGIETRIGTRLRALGRDDQADADALLVSAPVMGSLRDLIERRSGTQTAQDAASEELEAAAMALERMREDGLRIAAPNLPDDAGRLAGLRTALARLRQGDLSARLRLSEREVPKRARGREEAFAALAPWTGDGTALRALAMPDAAQIEAWRGALATLDSRRETERRRLDELAAEHDEQAARISSLGEGSETIDDAHAAELRAEREAAWQRHLAAMDRASAEIFEERMRAVDALGDLRLARAKDVAELRSLTARLAGQKVQLERQENEVVRIEAEWRALGEAIVSKAPEGIGLGGEATLAGKLSRIERWSALRDHALRAEEEWLSAEDEARADRSEAAQAQAQIQALLGDPAPAVDGMALDALADLAERALADAAERIKAREAHDAALRERERELANRQRAADKARAAMDVWREAWEAALSATWFRDKRGDPGAVRAILDALGDLAGDLRERTDLNHRMATMERDQQDFVTELGALFAALGEKLDPNAVLISARALAERHARAKRDLERRRSKEAELDALLAERATRADELKLHGARKAEILAFFGVQDLVEASHALARCAERDRLETERKTLAVRIEGEMQAASIEAALLQLEALDLEALKLESADLAGRIEELEERVKQLFAERTRAEDRLNAIGGDDAVARIEGERRTVLLDIEDLALRYLRLKTGSLLAAQALRAYRDKHRSSMMDRASEAFRLITRDAYSGLAAQPDKDRETLIGLSQGGGSKLAADMSKGTRFQLYLALRMAGYEEFAAVRPSVPFIADDILETFDEPRSEEVFRLFARMAEIGQVIYLTHHRHLCDIARQVVPDVHIHELPS